MRQATIARVAFPLAAGVLLVLLVGSTWAARLPYPYDLEWMEGGMLAHAWRVQHGLPIYAPPSPEFVPYIYPPGYSWLLAALGSVVGLAPWLGRLISIAGTIAAAGSLGFAIRRLGGSPVVAFCTAAVFLGTYPAGGAFFDLVRPDGLCLGLTGWSIALALVPDRRAAIGSGLLLAAGFLVKQNVAAFGLPLLLAIAMRDGRRSALGFAAASIGPALAAVAWLQWSTGGWFLRYLVDLPSTHPVAWDGVLLGAPREWGTPLPVAIAVVVGAVLWTAVERTPRKALAAFASVVIGMLVASVGTYAPPPPETGALNVPSGVAFFAIGAVPTALGFVIAAWVRERRRPTWQAVYGLGLGAIGLGFAAWMRGHVGGYLNVHLPAFYVLSLGFGWACARAEVGGSRTWVAAAMVLQIGWALARFDRPGLVPTPADYEKGAEVVAAIKEIDGPVLSPFAAWLPVYAGKDPSLHYQGLWDLELSDRYHDRTKVVLSAVQSHQWAAVLGGNQKFPYRLPDFYQPRQTLIEGKNRALFPKTGFMARPERLLIPR